MCNICYNLSVLGSGQISHDQFEQRKETERIGMSSNFSVGQKQNINLTTNIKLTIIHYNAILNTEQKSHRLKKWL